MAELRDHRWTDPDATTRAGVALGQCLAPGDLVGLIGDLGAGKTLLVQGIARGLAVPPEIRITSPTFTLVNEYLGGRVPLYHADLYRLHEAAELDEIGLDDVCRRGDGALCVEWHDRFPVLGDDYLDVRIQVISDTERAVSAIGTGPRSAELAAAWMDRLGLTP